MLDKTDVLSDRFHYRSHKCSSLFDPDIFSFCDGLMTSVAESLNRRLAASRNHIRYLFGDNLVPFPYSRIIFLNLRMRIRQQFDKEDVEYIDIYSLFEKIVPLHCSRCAIRAVREASDAHETSSDGNLEDAGSK